MSRFSVTHWSAWAPGLADQAAWSRWLAAPTSLACEAEPAVREMPAMMRRRAERLGRAALQVAYWCQGDTPPDAVIFASRYGEINRSIDLLDQLAAQQPLSPASFSMSVHNAVGALYSIARGDTANYLAVAAGEDTVASAFVEATALLADGANEVLVVAYEGPLPERYQRFAGAQAQFPWAWSCRLAAAACGGISLQRTAAPDDTPCDLPGDLAILRFLVSEGPTQLRQRNWQWQRHA
ncbi:beta-ketoacyl synthase chain length factor [Chitinolyticbacter albus]|uniref:beta-ketoacyl synthase chain length factor n=1 Tax=Chitinolyticbacter albus TaxID=2961951 RepID=UPI002108ED5B|nr:beta-ketoacyl synthase chain length factor [Chitinolyticbacter albus]